MVLETSESRNVVSYLDLLIDISNGDLVLNGAQLLTREMHMISILSISLSHLRIFQQLQLMVLTSHS